MSTILNECELELDMGLFFLFGRYLNLEPKYTKEEILLTSSTSWKLQVASFLQAMGEVMCVICGQTLLNPVL